MKIIVFGLGYVGTVTAAALARDGNNVVGCDISRLKVENINNGHTPIIEDGLDKIISQAFSKGLLHATQNPTEGISGTDISIICVGTPSNSDGSLNLNYVKNVSKQIGIDLKLAAKNHLVVVRSTVLPGSVRNEIIPIIEKSSGQNVGDGWDICFNPEFLREGIALKDYDSPPRILVGERKPGTGVLAFNLYRKIKAPKFSTSLEVAEAIKYTDNAFHALKICFANEMARLWNNFNADPVQIMDIVAKDRKLNISPAYLKPGFAFGGSCLPKDLRAIIYAARNKSVSIPMLDSIITSNEIQIKYAFNKILSTNKRHATLLGLAFKPGTDDLRESPFVELVKNLIGEGLQLKIYDNTVLLGKIHGSNKIYLEEQIPHISRLLCESIDEAVKDSEIIIISHSNPAFNMDDIWQAEGKEVIRLT